MSFKLIVTDLDGTLLRTDKTLSEYTVSVFRRCRVNGVRTVFATARPIRTVVSMGIGIETDAAIYHNGAVIAIEGEGRRHIGIDHETTTRLLLQASGQFGGMGISVEIDDVLYANFDVSTIWTNTTAVTSDFSDLPDIPADKIIFGTAETHIVSEIRKMLPDDLYAEVAENQILMVMNKRARKRSAVKAIAGHFGLSSKDIAAFGDDYNDIEMLRYCGAGVAVANAIDEVKAVASHICDSNDNDGVAKWLEENVL